MGKDKERKSAGVDIGFKTKDALREEDVELTKDVKQLERKYQDIYQSVDRLSAMYQTCKEHFALTRYGDLKDMIKACICDETMQKAAQFSAAQNPTETGKAVSLVKAAKQFAGAGEAAARDEVGQLHKAEIVVDIEEKKKKKDKLEKKFLRLHNRLEKLKRDYEESKEFIPTKRYLLMKEMIKPLIRDDMLKADV